VLPALSGALVCDAVGQAVGYLTGAGRAIDTLADFEAERMPHLVAADRGTLLEQGDETTEAAGSTRVSNGSPFPASRFPFPAPVRFGIIGCGRVVQISHLRSLQSIREARIIALAEPDEARRAEAAARVPEARAEARWESVIGDPEVDAVLVAAPPALHAEIALAAFSAGKHVYLEKPIATSLPDAGRIIDAWRPSGLVGMIGHNLRCHPLYTAARNRIEQDHIGTPVLIRTAFTAALRDLPDWKRAAASGGGVVLDLAIHHVDLCRFLLGDEVANAELEEWGAQFEGDSALLRMRMRSGVRVESFFSLCTVSDDQCEITGDKGRLVIDRYAGDLRFVPPRQSQSPRARAGREVAGVLRAARRVLRPPGEPSYRLAMERFVRAIGDGGVALPDLDDGYRALEVVLGARRAR
jgi:predicted dehydrogenase